MWMLVHVLCKWRAALIRILLLIHYCRPFANPKMLLVGLDWLCNTLCSPVIDFEMLCKYRDSNHHDIQIITQFGSSSKCLLFWLYQLPTKKANFSPMNCYFGVCQWFIDIVSSTNEWLAIFSKYFAIIVNDVEKKNHDFFCIFMVILFPWRNFFSIAIVFVAKVNQKLSSKSFQEAEKSAQYIDHYFHKFSLNTLWKLYNYCETFEHNNRRPTMAEMRKWKSKRNGQQFVGFKKFSRSKKENFAIRTATQAIDSYFDVHK